MSVYFYIFSSTENIGQRQEYLEKLSLSKASYEVPHYSMNIRFKNNFNRINKPIYMFCDLIRDE